MGFLELLAPFCAQLHQVSAPFRRGVTLKGGGARPGHLSLILLTFTAALSLLPVPGNGARHRCYVCLPDDKTSSTSKDIQLLFPGKTIPDCSKFPNVTTDDAANIAHEYEFDCPNDYTGCSLRYTDSPTGIHGARTCTPRHSRNCYSVNSIVLCYCAQSLCNRDKATAQQSADLPLDRDPIRTSRYFSQGLTDDEELLPAAGGPRPSFHRQRPTPAAQGHYHHNDNGDEDEGSGHFDEDEDSEEYDEDDDELVKPVQPSAGHNVSHAHEPNGDHLITIAISTGNNETTHSAENDNEAHHPSHTNNPDSSIPELDNPETSNENVNGSITEDQQEMDRDAPTINRSDRGHKPSLSNILLLISSLVYLVTTTTTS